MQRIATTERNGTEVNGKHNVTEPNWKHFLIYTVCLCCFFMCILLCINMRCIAMQIFYDLVRQINSKTPEKPEKKKKHRCLLL